MKIKFKKQKKKDDKNKKKPFIVSFSISVIIGLISFLLNRNIISSSITALIIFVFLTGYIFARKKLKESMKIKKMEDVFPDFLQLVSSNLRAGVTTDRALLLSARKEFDPLDKEIIRLGKDLVTGEKIEIALTKMGERINSEKIRKTIKLIVSSIMSGGNLAILLEQTSINMREKSFVEKRASSNVLMYVIFIFFATAVGAPALFALSTVLVEVLTGVLSTIPAVETSARLPFTLSKVSISTSFIIYFAVIFMLVTDVIGSLVLGLVSKGEEKQGIKFMIPLLAISITVFFLIRIALGGFFADFFG